MSYDPFARGPFPVGVRTVTLDDSARSRQLEVELWYPAAVQYQGGDLDEQRQDAFEALPGFPPVKQAALRDAAQSDGKFPLVVFSHGFGGHRRQTTHLCTHLASHGYVVVAMDHSGNTIVDVMQMTLSLMSGGELPDIGELLASMIEARPQDVSFTIDSIVEEDAGGLASIIDAGRIGMSGHSFGGWTTLSVSGSDERIRAALPLAPAGGASPLPGEILRESLDLDWGREVPTLYLVADRDTLLPLDGMRELFDRTRSPKRMVVLENADHMHFCDNVEATHEMFRMMPPPGPLADIAKLVPPSSELCPGENAYTYLRGLGLAHMDAVLKESEAAAALLAGDIRATLAERGVAVSLV